MKTQPTRSLNNSGRYPPPPIELFNPINAEELLCANYHDVHMVEGVSYITVYKAREPNRSFLMRKDALRKKLK